MNLVVQNKEFRKVIFKMTSCMCNNISFVKVEKREDRWTVSHYNDHCALAFSNLQCDCNEEDIIWEVEDGNWHEVVRLLNSGTSTITDIKGK